MNTTEKLLSERKLPKLPVTREEMLAILEREEYGPVPPAPEEVAAEALEPEIDKCAGHAVYGHYMLRVCMPSFRVSFPIRTLLPKKYPEGGAPCFVLINFRPEVPDWYLPAEEIIDRGYGVISIYYNDITNDREDGYTTGIAPVMRTVYGETSKISLWAWACSRALDYALTLPGIAKDKIAVIGHSRLGKTALWAGANDERFAAVISNDSGCSGAAISRGKIGESIARISTVFPYWSTDAYKAYADREYEAPFDQHFLLASVAPRLLIVHSASEDSWADPVSEYLSCCAAEEAWKRAGKPGFDHPDRLPEIGERIGTGSINYCLREGAHCLSRTDWVWYMDYLDTKFR